MSKVVLKGVRKIYDKKVVIDNIDLEIKDKEFIVLVGASGCGKSTILRMIAGLEDITGGEILIGDKKVNNIPPKDRDIAFVFQSYALYPHMTVRENIAFGLKMRKVDKAEIEKKVKEAAEILDLTEYLDRKPKQLSDAKLRVQMRSEIKKLHEKLQTTFIYVTHDQTEALTMGDRIVVLDKGVIQQVASPDEIYNNPQNTFVAGFVGSPQMNFIDGENLSPDYAGKTAGIRPEKMTSYLFDSSDDDTIKLTADVDMTELLGSEKIIYFNIGQNKCSAKLPADFSIDKTINISIKRQDIYLFDRETGKRIN